jgi:hypothetical protein
MMGMKWLESWKEERMRKKEEDHELVELYEEVVRRFYFGPGFEG